MGAASALRAEAAEERLDAHEAALRSLEVNSNVRLNELDLASKRHEDAINSNTRRITELDVKVGCSPS
eukprot:354094-Chlamydomonas_euryale.AAC.2